ncbi:XF1762 family protein [Microbispora sp. NPDC046973]|uniref:XF1762 family protein n=1 Tax=Microbispora sp. NPDC046973 TaxID=3155022 RepID=UPI0033DCF7E3
MLAASAARIRKTCPDKSMERRNGIQKNAGSGGLATTEKPRLLISPVAIQTARAFTAWTHRYLAPPAAAEFVIGVQTSDTTLVGVAFVDTLAFRAFDDGSTAEVVCLSTDGTPNACSALLGAAWRAAQTEGYRRLIAYTRIGEPGTSLCAAGFRLVPSPVGWDTSRTDEGARVLWEIRVAGGRA